MSFEALTSCAELTNEHAEQAVRSQQTFRAFIAWAASVAQPREGAPKVLMAIARLTRASWMEGAPKAEIRAEQNATTLSIFAEHGAGIRERLAPIARLQVPFEELAQAIRLAPQLITPFTAIEADGTILLSPPGAAEESEAIRIDERSLNTETTSAPAGGTPPAAPATVPDMTGPHTHPTVRQMVAIRPEALRDGPSGEPDDDDG